MNKTPNVLGSELEMVAAKNKFLDIINTDVKREGIDKLVEWLEKSDFFYAPASTKFHSCYAGGLLQHSLNVYEQLLKEVELCGMEVSKETIAIVALLHDLCKANFYKVDSRNVKNEDTGKWEKVPYYTVDEKFSYGHGEKSVFLIERFIRLSTNEAVAIRCHMGGFDESAKAGSYMISDAFNKVPLALLLHISDMKATFLSEKGE